MNSKRRCFGCETFDQCDDGCLNIAPLESENDDRFDGEKIADAFEESDYDSDY